MTQATVEEEAEAKGDYSLTLGRGLEILSCFTPERPVLDILEIANAAHLARTTAHRFVLTLERAGYLVRDRTPEGSRAAKYRLGLRVLDLGRSTISATPMPIHARPILWAIAAATGHRVSVGTLAGPTVLIAECAAAPNGEDLLPEVRVGSQLPAHCTALGKVLLAALPVARRSRQLGSGRLAKHRPATIANRQALGRELVAALDQGFAANIDELWRDVTEIAVPVVGHDGQVVAALSIAAHRSIASSAELRKCRPRLEAGAGELSAYLGNPQQSPTVVVEPVIVAELRTALVDELLASQDTAAEAISSNMPGLRAARYREIAEELQARADLHDTIGWPDDPLPDGAVTIRGARQIDLAIRCLKRRKHERMDLSTFEILRAQDPPRQRRAVDRSAGDDPAEQADAQRAVGAFLAANEPASA